MKLSYSLLPLRFIFLGICLGTYLSKCVPMAKPYTQNFIVESLNTMLASYPVRSPIMIDPKYWYQTYKELRWKKLQK